MLNRATENEFKDIEKLCCGSIIGTKLLCQIISYGFQRDFLEAWIMRDGQNITAVMTKFYDDVTLVATDEADFSQLKAFFDMFYYNSVMCSKLVREKIGFENFTVKNGYVYEGELADEKTDKLCEDDYFEAYSLISREIPGSFKEGREAYLSFLSDFTFRERRGLARGVCTHVDGKLSSVAVTSAETPSHAIISGVACNSSLRKTGLGKKTVLSITADLINDGKKVFVIALNESAEGFYEHIGFAKKEKIAFVERKNDV